MMNNWIQMPSGVIVSDNIAELALPRKPTGGDFFAGCGGFSLGFIQAGYEVLFAVEIDVAAAVTYMVNLCRYGEVKLHFVTDEDQERMEKYLAKLYRKRGGIESFAVAGTGWISHCPDAAGVKHVIIGDVRKLTGRQILGWIGLDSGELDCVFGGPPCQGFSAAGKQDIADPRNNLVFEYARMICELRPKTMVMENVPGLINMVTPEGVPVVEEFISILEEGNYSPHQTMEKAFRHQTGLKLGRLRKIKRRIEPDSDDVVATNQEPELFDL